VRRCRRLQRGVGTSQLVLAQGEGKLRGIYRIVFTTEYPAGNIEA